MSKAQIWMRIWKKGNLKFGYARMLQNIGLDPDVNVAETPNLERFVDVQKRKLSNPRSLEKMCFGQQVSS